MIDSRISDLLAELASLSARRAQVEAELALALREAVTALATPAHVATALPEYLDTREVAALLGVSERHLKALRAEGHGPPFARVGRAVRYPRKGLFAWR